MPPRQGLWTSRARAIAAGSQKKKGASVGLSVGLVARCLNTAHIRGMGRYVYELLEQSQTRSDLSWLLFGDDPRYPMTAPQAPRIQTDIFSFRGDRFEAWEQLGLPLRARQRRVDLLHCTEGTLPWWQPRPTVVTVHDTLMWEEREDGRFRHFYFERLMPQALRRCAAVITISESSRHDILARWPWLEPKLSVIPHGISADYFSDSLPALPDELQARLGDSPYIVYLGGPPPRKRFDWALQTFARSRHPGLKLVACGFGAAARSAALAQLPPQLQDRVLFAPFLSDAELRGLYGSSAAVLYPTLYEGFGFPAIEAQAAGVPVIFSPLGSLKELIGPLSLVVPAQDEQAWSAALDEALALSQGEARAERAAAARAWARRFEWSVSFDKHLAVYRRAAASGVSP